MQDLLKEFKKLRDVKIRKSSIWFVVLTLAIAAIGWLIFLVFFGRISPIIKATTEENFKLYNYSLVTLPFWLYAFFAPFVYPVIALYILNGNWIVGITSHIAGAALGFLLGAVANMSAAVIHVIRNLDHNVTTRNICIVGMIAVVGSLINLIAMMVAMPTYDRWSNTRKLRTIAKHIEVTVGKKSLDWSDSDFEEEMEGIYVNTNQSPNRTIKQDPHYANVQKVTDRGHTVHHKSSSASRLTGPPVPTSPRPPIPSGSRPPSSPLSHTSSRPAHSPARPPPTRPAHPPQTHVNHSTSSRQFPKSQH